MRLSLGEKWRERASNVCGRATAEVLEPQGQEFALGLPMRTHDVHVGVGEEKPDETTLRVGRGGAVVEEGDAAAAEDERWIVDGARWEMDRKTRAAERREGAAGANHTDD